MNLIEERDGLYLVSLLTISNLTNSQPSSNSHPLGRIFVNQLHADLPLHLLNPLSVDLADLQSQLLAHLASHHITSVSQGGVSLTWLSFSVFSSCSAMPACSLRSFCNVHV